MRLITLNIWGGKQFHDLMEFVRREAAGTDVFCFQEVFRTSSAFKENRGWRVNIFDELAAALPGFTGFFKSDQDGFDFDDPVDFPLSSGLAMFVRKRIPVSEEQEFFVYGERNQMIKGRPETRPRIVHAVRIGGKNTSTICNFHGYWYPGPKDDVPERIEQSKKILAFLATVKGAKILCGDFNLLPDTRSLRMLEEGGGLRNLVKEFGVSSTRSRLYAWPDKFADYILVSPEVKVEKFEVLQDVVSDHLPLMLDFSIQ